MLDFNNQSVAVVGSSGHLLERDYASFIDQHKYVIRFNQARVEGYETFVGSKTTHRVVNTHTFLGTTGNDRFPSNDPMFIPKLTDQVIVLNRPVDSSRVKERSPNNKVVTLSDKFWDYCKELLGNVKDPSVGFLGVMLALNSTMEVNIFGFDQVASTYKKHYWEEVRAVGNWHSFSFEKKYFKMLAEKKLITIFK